MPSKPEQAETGNGTSAVCGGYQTGKVPSETLAQKPQTKQRIRKAVLLTKNPAQKNVGDGTIELSDQEKSHSISRAPQLQITCSASRR